MSKKKKKKDEWGKKNSGHLMATYKQKRKEGWRKNLECYHPEGSLKKNGRMKKKDRFLLLIQR